MNVESYVLPGAANTVANGALWLQISPTKSVVVYGSSNLLVVYDAESLVVDCTLKGHQSRVNALTSLRNRSANISSDENVKDILEVISSSDDGTLRVWQLTLGEASSKDFSWKEKQVLDASESNSGFGKMILDAINISNGGSIIVTSDVNGTVFIWYRRHYDCIFKLVEQFECARSQLPHTIKVISLYGSSINAQEQYDTILLVLGTVDSRILFRTANVFDFDTINSPSITSSSSSSMGSNIIFKPCGFLSGHEDWITCLADISVMHSNNSGVSDNCNENAMSMSIANDIYFASGSQDSKIRVWKISLLSRKNVTNTVQPVKSNADLALDSVIDQEDELFADTSDVVLVHDEEEESANARLMIDITSGKPFDSNNSNSDSDSNSTTEPIQQCDSFGIFLEAICLGHEDWITSLHWMRSSSTSSHSDGICSESDKELRLFSTSMDRNMIIWSPDKFSGVWAPMVRTNRL
jgi:hypothetical protein